jgi:hypothetical protein
MKTLRNLGPSIALAMVLASRGFAQIDTPPCASPEPGQTSTPPCEMQLAPSDRTTSAGGSAAQGDKSTPANETSLAQIAADLLLNLLPLF